MTKRIKVARRITLFSTAAVVAPVAPSPIVVMRGCSSTVDASTPRPTVAPSSRSHTGVNRLE